MEQNFKTVITPDRKWYDFNIQDLWNYRDLIVLFVRRTFVSKYKQTVLGPAWAIIQPLFTTVIYTVIFGNIAGLAPSGVPTFAFYLCGYTAWCYFAGCLTETSSTFTANASIMGKVYFPRLVMPISTVLSQLISFAIQGVFFVCFLIYYMIVGECVHPNVYMLLTPILVLQMACLGLGFGVIIASVTTKYRDLVHMIGFCVQLWMYVTPIAYDIGIIPEKYMNIYLLNPITPIINTFRYAFLGIGSIRWDFFVISWIETLVVLFIGVILFNKVEKTFMDTV